MDLAATLLSRPCQLRLMRLLRLLRIIGFIQKAQCPMLALLYQAEPIVADEAEAAIAKTAAASLAPAARAGQGVQLVLREQPNVVVPLPARAVEAVFTVLGAMAERRPISVIPHEAELTTQQAADYLNVSRPFLIGLIDRGEIPHRMHWKRWRRRRAGWNCTEA